MRQRDNKTIPSRSQDLPLLVPYKHFPVNFSVDKMSNGCVYTGESHNPVDLSLKLQSTSVVQEAQQTV